MRIRVFSALVMGALLASAPAYAQSSLELAKAVTSANVAAVERLLDAGADPDESAPDYGQSPLELACGEISSSLDKIEFASDDATVTEMRAKIANYRTIIEALLAAGADPDAEEQRHNQSYTGGPTPLMAGQFAPDCVEPLLAAGADPNARMTFDNSSVLEVGIHGGIWSPDRIVGLALLLEAGADAQVNDEDGNTLKWVLSELFMESVERLSFNAGTLDVDVADRFKYMLYAHEMLDAAGVFDFGSDSVLKVNAMHLLLGIGVEVGGVRGNLEDLGTALSGMASLTGRWGAYADIEAPGFREDMLSEEMPVRRVLRNFTGI